MFYSLGHSSQLMSTRYYIYDRIGLLLLKCNRAMTPMLNLYRIATKKYALTWELIQLSLASIFLRVTYSAKSLLIFATSEKLLLNLLKLSSFIQTIYPSLSTMSLFDLCRYLRIVCIFTRFRDGTIFCRSLIFGYPSTFFIEFIKIPISRSEISLEASGFFFFNFFLCERDNVIY